MLLEHDVLMDLVLENFGERGILLLCSWTFVERTLMYFMLASQFNTLTCFTGEMSGY